MPSAPDPAPTRSPFDVALIDLDGTIVDSAPGITATLAFTLTRMGLPVPPPATLVQFVGPPILDGFRDVAGLDAAQSAMALHLYRARYREVGAYDATIYPGIESALAAVRDAGVALAVATSKPEIQATRILQHFGLAGLFTVIAGASEDEVRSGKADVITRCLELLRDTGVEAGRAVMVGDRIHDVHGAAAHGIPTIFAGWGYGSATEAAGTWAIANTPESLVGILLDGRSDAAPTAPRT